MNEFTSISRSDWDKWGCSGSVGMNPHVNAHLLGLAESATADITLKRFLSGMSADMLSQMIPSPEAFGAVLALEHSHRALRCNNCHSKNLNSKLKSKLKKTNKSFYFCSRERISNGGSEPGFARME